MKIVIIGSGNVATVLGRIIKLAGHIVTEVVGRGINHTEGLAKELDAKANTDINLITKEADIYIIAVSDGAIKSVAETLMIPGKIVVHTSGTISKDVLQKSSDYYGAIYPLQSLRKEVKHIPQIPLLIDGNTTAVIKSIMAFAETVSKKIKYADDTERLKLHISAVFVSNFTNHLYTLAADYCEKGATDFSLLIPLIQEVASRIADYNPITMQTGPAVRGDAITIHKHLELLSAYPELQKIYRVITESIQQFYSLS